MKNALKNKAFKLTVIYLFIVILKAMIIRFFPSPWIFSDEQSYFGMANKISDGNFSAITNSHMPGYPLIISVINFLPSIMLQYKAAQLLNVIMTSSIFFLAYMLMTRVFDLEEKKAILISVITSFLPSVVLYNYTIMSENLYITLFYLIVLLLFFVTDKYKGNKPLWIILGVLVGFTPIVRSQSLFLLGLYFIFCLVLLIPKFKVTAASNIFLTIASSLLTYAIFKYLIFAYTGLYSDLTEGYFKYTLLSLASTKGFVQLMQIFMGEISYFFVSLFFIPTFALYFFLNKKRINNKGHVYILCFIAIFTLVNILITTLHANFILHTRDKLTIYARYLDFLLPLYFTLGSIGVYDSMSMKKGKKTFLALLSFVSFCIFFFYSSQNYFANTFTIYLFQYLGDMFGKVLLILVSAAGFYLLYKHKIKLLFGLLVTLFMISNLTTINEQYKFSQATFKYYAPLGYWFDENRIVGESIVIDNSIMGNAVVEGKPYSESNIFDYTHFYSLMFWARSNNNIETGDLEESSNQYIVTTKMLPRKILAQAGSFILYDKTVKNSIDFNNIMLSRFCSGLNGPEEDWIWINNKGEMYFNDIFLPDVYQLNMNIELKGHYPGNLQKQVELYVNNKQVSVQNTLSNTINFSITQDEKFNVNSIKLKCKTWNPVTMGYANENEGLGLDLKSVNINFSDAKHPWIGSGEFQSERLMPYTLIKNMGTVNLYSDQYNPTMILDPKTLFQYGSGLAIPEADWVWMTGSGQFDLEKLLIPNVRKVLITINLGGFWPKDLNKEVKLYVNGEKVGIKKSKGNRFEFLIDKTSPITIESIMIGSNSWNPKTYFYANNDDGLGLDIKDIGISIIE